MIPDELKSYPQWVLWRSIAKPDGFTKVPYSALGSEKASVTDPSTWATYSQAVDAAKRQVCGIGFVLTKNDPYSCIDLDPAHGDAAIVDRQVKIEQAFDSYSELSPSREGLHIWVKGYQIPKGRKRAKVEVYSSERFFTVTEWTFRDKPIEDRSELLRILWEEIGGSDESDTPVNEEAQKHDDNTIYTQARDAANGDKFIALWQGRWSECGYSSQSEADFALINILSFYSRNCEQIKRLFLFSGLGQRDKAKRKAYVDKMIQRSFDNQPAYIDLSELAANAKKELKVEPDEPSPNPFAGPLFANIPDAGYDYTNPPGLLGEIASFIYESAPRQVKEIALATSIGLMAGMCGRAYNISGTGLNQYVLLLAKTGRGKDSVSSGIDKLMRDARVKCPSILEFLGPSAIASGQALIKHLSSHPCFVSILGEFGLTLQALCSFNANPSQIMLRKTLLELYTKSGHNEVLRSTIYSDKNNNTPIVASPSFSMLAESTPQSYYAGLDESMIAQGLLPRFLCIEYLGKQPYINKGHMSVKPSEELSSKVADLAVNCFMLAQNSQVIDVKLDEEAQSFADDFSKQTTDNVNQTDVTIAQELWNRAHLKMLKLSALIAVGVNPYTPVVTLECMKWAHDLVTRDIKNVFARFDRGQIGKETSETGQVQDIEELIKEYLTRPYDGTMKKYRVDPRMHADRIISWSYLFLRGCQMGSFRNDRFGATSALKRVIESFLMDGSIKEVRQMDLLDRYKRSQKSYAVTEPERFINKLFP